ncbi:hypothetical protein ACFSQP_08855 [Bizionia sediminis]|uniref:Uncharacterized protein n=1 Tax=Bizionia sediminis TaxID=1737064 RepID=A0ABW5KSV3_9FLAO
MKKVLFSGILSLGIVVTAFASSNFIEKAETIKEFKKPKLVTFVCESGYSFQYYEVDGYSQADYKDMQNAACNDPNNY